MSCTSCRGFSTRRGAGAGASRRRTPSSGVSSLSPRDDMAPRNITGAFASRNEPHTRMGPVSLEFWSLLWIRSTSSPQRPPRGTHLLLTEKAGSAPPCHRSRRSRRRRSPDPADGARRAAGFAGGPDARPDAARRGAQARLRLRHPAVVGVLQQPVARPGPTPPDGAARHRPGGARRCARPNSRRRSSATNIASATPIWFRTRSATSFRSPTRSPGPTRSRPPPSS